MNTKPEAVQVNPIVQAAADQVRNSKRRNAKDLLGGERRAQSGLFEESEVKR
ncbi:MULTISPECIES: hypothetical protein [Nocardia]|uniref:hypothetical protein n=1 Tax=Nocardia TaxID=1817 RepID=UPI000A85E0CB|nr:MULTISPECIES: hypothetical protein [Nocardia]